MPHDLVDRLRRELALSLGLTLPLVTGCTQPPTPDDEAAGVTTDPSSSSSASASSESGSEEGMSDPVCETTYLITPESLDPYPGCNLPLYENDCGNEFWLACVDLPAGQTCDEMCPSPDKLCSPCDEDPVLEDWEGTCGPYEQDGQCCTLVNLGNDCWSGGFDSFGRPFVVGAVGRTASLDAGGVESGVRRRLLDHWTRVAEIEHASVASFARFAAQLLGLGAPAELVRDACAAARDEVRHAAIVRDHCEALAGRELSFGSLDVSDAGLDESPTLARMVEACIEEGCIGETLSALRVAAAADACEEPEFAVQLRGIADDELRHASLAWRAVRWALERDPKLVPVVAARFETLAPPQRSSERFDERELRMLARHGFAAGPRIDGLLEDALERVLVPCAEALLASMA